MKVVCHICGNCDIVEAAVIDRPISNHWKEVDISSVTI